MKFTVEKGIPIPEPELARYMRDYGKNLGKKLPSKYPFRTMEVGDSFAIPPGVSTEKMRVTANNYGHKLNVKFILLLDANKQPRIWRLS